MRISAFLGKLFNLRPGEWRRLSLLYAMSLVTLTGCNWADAIVQGAFLQRVGVKYLPWVIISSAGCSVVALFIYSAFADRVSNRRLLIGILAISGTGILLGLTALGAGLVGPAYLLLFVVLQVPLLDVYNVHWATYVNGFYDIRTAKRIVPVLSTSARLAGIIGGLSMPLMNRLFNPAAIIAASVLSLAVMGTLAALMPRLMRERDTGTRGYGEMGTQRPGEARTSCPRRGMGDRVSGFARAYGANLREGYRQIARSRFLRWMAVSTLCMTLLMTMLNYQASAIFQEQLKTTVAISDFLGVLTGIANLVVLPIQLFLLSRLIAGLGLSNAGLVYPLVTLASAGSLAVAPGLGTAALAYLDRTALRTAFRIPTDNLLYNAVPQRVKARTRAFVGGLVIPIGGIVGALLLLTPLMSTSWFLPAGMLILAIALVLAALMVRRQYGPALVDLLEQEDYSSLALQEPSLQEPATFAPADPSTLDGLAQKLKESTSPERAIFMAQLISAVGGEAAVPIVGQAARGATDGRLRALLLDVLVAADARGGAARALYTELLADSDGRVRLSALEGLEQINGPVDARYLKAAAGLLADPEVEVRLRAAGSLLAADDASWQAAGRAELHVLLNSSHPHDRARALDVLGRAPLWGRQAGQAHASEFLPQIVRSLGDGADEVRLAAALALEVLVGGELPGTRILLGAGKREALLESVPALLYDPIERARVAAVTVLGRLSADDSPDAKMARESLMAGLIDPSPEVRERTVEVLASAGHIGVPQVREQLDAADPHLRKMAGVVLARIDPRRYGSLVRGPILDGNLHTIYRELSCLQALAGCSGPAAALLGRALRERRASLLDEIFYLLATIRDPVAIQTIANSLRSPQPEVRANATEALESLTSPQTAALVGALFEPEPSSAPAQANPPSTSPGSPVWTAGLSLARQTWDVSISTPAAALQVLLSLQDGSQGGARDVWQRSMAAAALAELSARVDPGSDGQLAELLRSAQADPDANVRAEVSAARVEGKQTRRGFMLSSVEKVIRLRELPFFQAMTADQLRTLANVCEEESFPVQARLFSEGDPGGVLYVVVEGRVRTVQQKRPGSFVPLATVEAGSYLGETEFFDSNPCAHSAIAMEDTRALRLRREPLIALARQHPDLSLELINVLSVRLREANDRIAELTRTHPRELHKLFDQFT
jgi:HEAT repeat protein